VPYTVLAGLKVLELGRFIAAPYCGKLLAIALEHRIPLAPVRGYDEVRHDPSLADLFVDIDRADIGPLPSVPRPSLPTGRRRGGVSNPRFLPGAT
jgi:crotonobetainyl-CoA:carnitine CoA-transferase CaiB-like acyl-CoA transferase